MQGVRYIGCANKTMTATAGTVSCGSALKANVQVFLDTNSTYDVAWKPVTSATGTCSKNNCAAVVTDNGTYEAVRPGGGTQTWYLAWRVYNGATGIAGGAADKCAVEKLG